MRFHTYNKNNLDYTVEYINCHVKNKALDYLKRYSLYFDQLKLIWTVKQG